MLLKSHLWDHSIFNLFLSELENEKKEEEEAVANENEVKEEEEEEENEMHEDEEEERSNDVFKIVSLQVSHLCCNKWLVVL